MGHTPGPWRVNVWDYPHAKPPRKELNVENSENLLATLQCDFTGDNPYIISQAEAEANARLIAAAPDLLAALELAVRRISEGMHGKTDVLFEYGGDPGILAILEAALAKAKGAL